MDALVEDTLTRVLKLMGTPYTGVDKKMIAGQTIFSIQTDDMPALIGPHGDVIYALDMLVKKLVEKKLADQSAQGSGPEEPLFLIDVGDYRSQKIKDIEAKALMMAERARSFQYDVELSPMSAYERLIVHTVLSEQSNIKTESQGEGRNRRVIIRYVAA